MDMKGRTGGNRRVSGPYGSRCGIGIDDADLKYGFNDVLNEYTKLDPSRVAAGVVTAIGFLGSGMIIARNKSVSGITTSAGIWATVGVGLAVGSGMIYLGIATSVIVVLVEMFLGRGGIMGLHREMMSAVNVEISGGQKELLELKACIGGNGISYPQHRIFPKGKGNRQGRYHPWCSKTEEYCGASGIEAAVDHRTGSERQAAVINLRRKPTRLRVG